MTKPEKKTESSDEDQLLDEKLSHLSTKDAGSVKKIIRDYPEFIANSFRDVRLPTVSVTHRFELTSESPIYQKARRKSPSHKNIVRKEIDRMLAASITTTVESSTKSPAAMATKKDGSRRFCFDYRKLNSVTLADR